MEKLKRIIKLQENIGQERDIDDDENDDINEIINFLQAAIENGATHICWSIPYDSEYGEIQPVKIGMESDEEFQKRVNDREENIKKEAKQREIRERSILATLKAKYE